jgi:murein DD-endopeptidase MepM/ murein hydrolase activator NlpD
MAATIRSPLRLLLFYYLIGLHLVVVFFVIDKIYSGGGTQTANVTQPPPTAPIPEFSTLPSPLIRPSMSPVEVPTPNISGLIIPVAGIKPEQLTDSFSDARAEGRIHDAIDIMAPAGTPVLAAADGEIVKFWESNAGGITIYELSVDKKFVYYYAHLQRRADDLKEGDMVKRGRVIAYVGDTGNAGPGNYHLHFSIAEISDPKRYWTGVYINPYPLLRK